MILDLIKLAAASVTVNPDGSVKANPGSGFATGTLGGAIAKGVNVFAFIIGAVSVIMILVGAFRYVVSAGNPQATKEAKDTILYAVIGVVIAIASLAIARYVTGAIK
jgi:hypothetical protein